MEKGLFRHIKHEKIKHVMNLIHKDMQNTIKTNIELPVSFEEPEKIAKHTYRTSCKVIVLDGKVYPVGIFTGDVIKTSRSTAFVLEREFQRAFSNVSLCVGKDVYFGLRVGDDMNFDESVSDLVFDIDTKHLNYIVYDEPVVVQENEKGKE